MITKFDLEYRFLSNFYPCRIYYHGIAFPSVEHAYQASKTYDENIISLISNLHPNQAGKAKRIGQKCKLRSDWENIKLVKMEYLLRQKFEWPYLKSQLLGTEEKILIEGNYWHDNYYGNCFCSKCTNIYGQNHLGKLLMTIRKDLKK